VVTVKDPLDLFNEGFDIKSRRQVQKESDVEYPGKTPPKNRSTPIDRATNEWLTGLPFQIYSVGGVEKKFYTIGSLASALGRKPVTIRAWESKGWIPSATFRTPAPRKEQIPGTEAKGRRLYSEAQIVFLVETAIACRLNDQRNADWKRFRKEIADNYPKH
jgi:hypothetical protein